MTLPRRRGKPRPTAHAGLLVAWKRVPHTPDFPELDFLTGNNRHDLRMLVKVIFAMCDGTPGTRFFLGSVALGMVIGKPQRTALRWLGQLERQGVIHRTWTGRPCRKDENGKSLAAGRLVDRASEYIYVGLPRLTL